MKGLLDYPITRHLPCSVCGLETMRHSGWFLVMENHWLDRLRVIQWHPTLAAGREVKIACCREHLKTLIAHWLDKASLRFGPGDRPVPIAGDPGCKGTLLRPEPAGMLLGELSVHRDTGSRVWTGSPAMLESILEALIPKKPELNNYALDLHLVSPPGGSAPGLALH